MTAQAKLTRRIKRMQQQTDGYVKVLSNPMHPRNSGLCTETISELLETEKVVQRIWPIVLKEIDKAFK